MATPSRSVKPEGKWHALSVPAVLRQLEADRRGLTSAEAAARQRQSGANVLPYRRRSSDLDILLSQLRSPVVSILALAMVLTLVLRNWVDLGVIAAVIGVNTAFGFWQERKATREFEKLRALVDFRAHLRRDGNEVSLPVAALVAGDVVMLGAGDRVPADARLLEVNDLTVIEAPLTGESAPSPKGTATLAVGTALPDRDNMVYLGTTVASGRASAVVCAIGGATELGQIARLVSETAERPTPLQRQLTVLGRQLTVIVCSVAAVVLLIGLLQGRPLLNFGGAAVDSMLYVATTLAVAAIPEGLLVIVTLTLAIGMRAILKEGALVHRLAATETLGSTSIICTDKTGTITEGKMQVARVITPDEHYDFRHLLDDPRLSERLRLLKIAALCNDAVVENPAEELRQWRVLGSPTETALLDAAAQVGIRAEELTKSEPRVAEIPFRSDTKYMATLHQARGGRTIYGKGSPEQILDFCRRVEVGGKVKLLDAETRRRLTTAYETYTRQGLRLLGVAYRPVAPDATLVAPPHDLIFAGFIGLKDPLRPDAKIAYAQTRRAGIRTVMVTGDHRLTAVAIAREMGMPSAPERVVDGAKLDAMDDAELARRIRSYDIFSRVSPKHKLRIVAAWQARGAVVAMTGDGVNDAPALKAADLGIALNSGTDVAKETADLILLDNNFKTIIAVVRQGRIIYDNIRKAVLYLLSDSMSEVVLVSAALLMGLPLPLLPAQILWINLITDSLPALALAQEAGEPEVLSDLPRRKGESVVDVQSKTLIVAISLTITVLMFSLMVWLHARGLPLEYIRTIIFTQLAVKSLVFVFSIRSLRRSIIQQNFASNPLLIFAVVGGLLLQLAAVYLPPLQRVFHTVPLRMNDWALIVGLSIVVSAVIEITKMRLMPSRRRTQPER